MSPDLIAHMCSPLRWLGALETRDRAEQRAITKKIVAREHDQVLRMWMPFDAGFALWQPHLRNIGQRDLRGNFGYGSSTLARLWLDR